MVHGYHVIIGAYGYWLPNDPRGSWSDFVAKWELLRFGRATRTLERRSLAELTDEERHLRDQSRAALQYSPVQFSGAQARAIARGFAFVAHKRDYMVEATRQMVKEGLHPLTKFAAPGKRPPRMWSTGEWKGFLDSEDAVENAIAYVEQNPIEEGKPRQRWKFVRPFEGLDRAWTTYHDR